MSSGITASGGAADDFPGRVMVQSGGGANHPGLSHQDGTCGDPVATERLQRSGGTCLGAKTHAGHGEAFHRR